MHMQFNRNHVDITDKKLNGIYPTISGNKLSYFVKINGKSGWMEYDKMTDLLPEVIRYEQKIKRRGKGSEIIEIIE